MTTATLTKWGNGQGVNIPRSICEELGISVGDRLSLVVLDGGLRLAPTGGHRRSHKVTATELFEGWEGTYEPPADWPASGDEVDWGSPRGGEAW